MAATGSYRLDLDPPKRNVFVTQLNERCVAFLYMTNELIPHLFFLRKLVNSALRQLGPRQLGPIYANSPFFYKFYLTPNIYLWMDFNNLLVSLIKYFTRHAANQMGVRKRPIIQINYENIKL